MNLRCHERLPCAGQEDRLDKEGQSGRVDQRGDIFDAVVCSELSERLPEVGSAGLSNVDCVWVRSQSRGGRNGWNGVGFPVGGACPLEEARRGAGSQAGCFNRDGLEKVGVSNGMKELEVGKSNNDKDGDDDLDWILRSSSGESPKHDLGQ